MGKRYDNIGLFWEDQSYQKRTGGPRQEGPMPSIPETGWRAPTTFPNLSTAKYIAFDTETYDPDIKTSGPGWARGKGHVIGVSLATDDKSWYFPFEHQNMPEQNLSKEHVLNYLRDTLGNPKQPKIGANLIYDIGWLRQEGVEVKGELVDVLFAQALLNNDNRASLDDLGREYLGHGKETSLLYKWLSDWFGGAANGSQRKHLYRAPASLVGPYAEEDAAMPIKIAKLQYPLLKAEGLYDIFKMECRLIYLLLEMRWQGVTVNVSKAEQLRDELIKDEAIAQKQLDHLAGMSVDVNGRAIYKAFDALGLSYPLTENGAPSFTKTFLNSVDHDLGKAIVNVRMLQKMRRTFIESYILDNNIDGKLYGQFHPLRGESGGTGYGRFSSSTPNLQNIPSRNKIWAPKIRGLFMPDKGHKQWRKYDYSQIEYRFLAHFAVGPSAYQIQKAYADDPNTDYHNKTGDNVEQFTGQKLEDRVAIKSINFGTVYGMGKVKLQKTLNISGDAAESFFTAYHSANPFVKDTFNHYMDVAQNFGFVTTVLGRRARFDLFEPSKYDETEKPLPYARALEKYGNVKRAWTHKALNNILQGSSADLLKTAMVKCYDTGIFDYTGYPKLTVHDELDFSDHGESDEAYKEMKNIMQTCLTLKVPVIVDLETGPDWGNVK